MNELDAWARLREHERTVRRVEETAWQRWAAGEGAAPGPGLHASPVTRARRLVGRWVAGFGVWIAGAPVEAVVAPRSCAPRSSW